MRLDLQLSLHLDLEWAPGIEGPVPGRVEGGHGKPGSAPVGPAGAFAGVHEATPHQASGKTDRVKVEGLGHCSPENAANLFPV